MDAVDPAILASGAITLSPVGSDTVPSGGTSGGITVVGVAENSGPGPAVGGSGFPASTGGDDMAPAAAVATNRFLTVASASPAETISGTTLASGGAAGNRDSAALGVDETPVLGFEGVAPAATAAVTGDRVTAGGLGGDAVANVVTGGGTASAAPSGGTTATPHVTATGTTSASAANTIVSTILISTGAGNLSINLELDANAAGAPTSYISGWETAATLLSDAIHDPITVNIEVGYTEYPGDNSSITSGSAEGGGVSSKTDTYTQLRNFLLGTGSSDVVSAVNDLPSTSSLNGQTNFSVANAEAKAWQQISATATAIDGYTGFGSGIASDAIVGVALHEFTHAMGRQPGDTVLSLFDYTSSGSHYFGDVIPAPASYFSVDGGKTVLADFGISSDPSDFLNNSLVLNDPFDEFYIPGSTVQSLTSLDQTVLDMLGFGGGTTTVSSGQTLVVSAGQTDTGITVLAGGTVDVASGGKASGTVISSGGTEIVSSGGTDVSATVENGGSQTILSGGADIGTVMSGGSQLVYGTATNVVLDGDAIQTIESGGVAISATVSATDSQVVLSGGVASGTVVFSGGTEVVSAGGTTVDPVISGSGAVLDLLIGAVVSGGITFSGSGGELQIGGTTMPSNTIFGFVSSDTIDLTSIAFDSFGGVGVGDNNQLRIIEGGTSYDLFLDPTQNFTHPFQLSADSGSGTLISINPLTEPQSTLPVSIGGTATIATSFLLSTDFDYGAADLTYSVLTAPVHGIVLDNGAAATTFTQADIDNGLVQYRENGDVASSDSFSFQVTDPAGNRVGPERYTIAITNSTAPVIEADATLTAPVGGWATIWKDTLCTVALGEDPAEVTYTVLTAPAHGIILDNGTPATSFTQADIDDNLVRYQANGDTATSDSFTFRATNAAGNQTPVGTFNIAISNGDGPGSASAGTSPPFDLSGISFGASTTLGYAANGDNTGGTLTVGDGVHTASLALLGQYAAAGIATAADPGGGTIVTYTATQSSSGAPSLLTNPQH